MKVKKIEVKIKNNLRKNTKLKLPKKNSELKKSLLKNNITTKDNLKVKDFDNELKSVEDIEIKNFNIKKPTNIYYLNSYLGFLKTNNLDIPTESIDITTSKLKELIAGILNSDNKNMTLKEINNLSNNKNKKIQEQNLIKKKKPIFDINKMKKRHKERKKEERRSEQNE